MTDHYETLAIPRDAGTEAIVRAWKLAASMWHPDRASEPRREEYTAKFRAAREAFNCLMDREKRARHDASLNGAADAGLLSEDDFGTIKQATEVEKMQRRACMMCAGTGEVRVAADGFWIRRTCPACAA